MHDSSSRHAAPSGPTLPVWVTGRADSGLGVREAQPQGGFFFFFSLQAVISMETQTAVESGCLRSFYFSFSLRVTWECLQCVFTSSSLQSGPWAANPKRSALHSKVCWVLLSFQLSLKFAVTGTFCFFAITPPMTFQSSQQTLFTSSRGIKGHLTAGTQCKSVNVLINVNHSGVV